jgi:hypothetical protein
MSFFTLHPSSDGTSVYWFVSDKLYVFFACTVPITTIALALFMAEVPVIEWVRRYISQPLTRAIRGKPKSVAGSPDSSESALNKA